MQRLTGIAAALALVALPAHAADAERIRCNTAMTHDTLLNGWQLAMGGGLDVPMQYWGLATKALNPVAVRLDRGNLAVVTERSGTKESGIYYVLRGSQYSPKNSNGRAFNCSGTGGQLEFTFSR